MQSLPTILLTVLVFSVKNSSCAEELPSQTKYSYQNQMADIEFSSEFRLSLKSTNFKYMAKPNTSITIEGVIAENSMVFRMHNKIAHRIDGLRNRYGCDPIEEKVSLWLF